MATRAYIIGDSPVVLWGVPSRERLERQLAALPEVELSDDPKALGGADSALLLRADFLYELRTLSALLGRRGILADGDANAAAHVAAADVPAALALLTDSADSVPNGHLERFGVEALQVYEGQLRRNDPPTLAPLTEADRDALSSRLYGSAYKGITDLVTKYWWPKPAKRVVAWCAERGITPNAITLTGLALMLLAAWCFYEGAFLTGLVAGWIMTFLDTVDGKLARVTVRSSRVGHWLDHGMDIVHPPFWYWLWGLGLATPPTLWGLDATTLYVWLFVGYFGGRIAEALFHSLGELSLFAWRPFDAYFRLITGRRNPCLILLTLCTLAGSPAWGFLAVVIWTLGSTAVLYVRYLQGLAVRQHSGQPLEPWMADPAQAAREHPNAFRTFATTRSAYGDG